MLYEFLMNQFVALFLVQISLVYKKGINKIYLKQNEEKERERDGCLLKIKYKKVDMIITTKIGRKSQTARKENNTK